MDGLGNTAQPENAQGTTTGNCMDSSHRCNVEQKKPNKKEYILHDFTYTYTMFKSGKTHHNY